VGVYSIILLINTLMKIPMAADGGGDGSDASGLNLYRRC
jgi:hypothetical protein